MKEMIEYPYFIQLETSNSCNAGCSFCLNSRKEHFYNIPIEKIEEMLVEVSKWPVKLRDFYPFLVNEPFADYRILDILSLIEKYLPETHVGIFTNVELFAGKIQEKFFGLKNNKSLFFSLHTGNPVEYRKIFGNQIDFNKVCGNITKALARENKCPITLLRVSDGNTQADNEFISFCSEKWPGVPTTISRTFSWISDLKSKFPPPTDSGQLDVTCPRLGALYVNSQGKVLLCCLDYHASFDLGNIYESNLLDLYNSEKLKKFRSSKRRNTIPCKNCNMIYPT